MDKEDIAYCGLNCALCKSRFADIRQKVEMLDASFEQVNIGQIVKVIPFMRYRYRGYKKLTAFFAEECPGCRNKGGNPLCRIRRCAAKRDYFTCAECEDLCGKFKTLFKIHVDNEIQTNIGQIRKHGIDSIVEKGG